MLLAENIEPRPEVCSRARQDAGNGSADGAGRRGAAAVGRYRAVGTCWKSEMKLNEHEQLEQLVHNRSLKSFRIKMTGAKIRLVLSNTVIMRILKNGEVL